MSFFLNLLVFYCFMCCDCTISSEQTKYNIEFGRETVSPMRIINDTLGPYGTKCFPGYEHLSWKQLSSFPLTRWCRGIFFIQNVLVNLCLFFIYQTRMWFFLKHSF